MLGIGITEILLLALFLSAAVPIVKILRKAGYSAGWTILAFIPLLNFVALWWFAFSEWPSLTRDT